jgi:hypothetical protein
MTPKEKAEELYTHMSECVINPELTVLEMEAMAIQCALIAVDEILNVIIGSYDYELEKIYWQDVKNEIELL